MLIDRIYLRNYRVYEDELDLALPPGLVGIYGPNGAGKSTLLESIVWALWGKARTGKELVPSAGSRGECVAEITFEHEGHIYIVRRTISGAAYTVKAYASCDGLMMAEGARDTGRYVYSVLGMDDAAFRASVFAEQKQVAAFTTQGPAERRKLVLSLLGVTPLDSARDRARADARSAASEHTKLRSMLPDLAEIRTSAADAEAAAGAVEAVADDAQAVAKAARQHAAAASEAFHTYDRLRQEYELLVTEGKAARADLDAATKHLEALRAEIADLDTAAGGLDALEAKASGLAQAQRTCDALRSAALAAAELARYPELPEPEPADDAALKEAEDAAIAATGALGAAQAHCKAAELDLERATKALERLDGLAGQADCPVCGQPLGDAFSQVQEHHLEEQRRAATALEAASADLEAKSKTAAAARTGLERLAQQVESARRARQAWEQAATQRTTARARLEVSLQEVAVAAPGSRVSTAQEMGPELMSALEGASRLALAHLAECQNADKELSRLRGRLERLPAAKQAALEAQDRASTAASIVEALRSKLKGLGFDPAALTMAAQSAAGAETDAASAERAAQAARLEAVAARTKATAEAKRVLDAERQHANLAELETSALHLNRTAELLNAFRNSIVATVGPRLAVQAASLFAELTDNEYDRLEVDTDTYGLRISDGGISYDLDRFSGSEVDLANLALRVAISEHVRLLSGGTVGLLVLDEIFGPLDEERKARMLMALERLRGRFRQVLVVTHSTDIKEQLPAAVEVVKKPGRRAGAHVVEQG
ncbi:MAG TPA: SMC family ATPase [Acidimicrobiales bacterium]|nr:SMC family ATPase [Acidimicrobiales bacterium]